MEPFCLKTVVPVYYISHLFPVLYDQDIKAGIKTPLNPIQSELLSKRYGLSFVIKTEYFYSLNHPNANQCRAFTPNHRYP